MPAETGFNELAGKLFRFSVVGAVAALVFYLLLWGMVEWLLIPVLAASSLAFVVVTLENYALHYAWTFQSVRPHRSALPRFVIMNLGGFGLNWLAMWLGTEWLELNYLLVQAGAIAIVISWNLIVSSFWVFVDDGTGDRRAEEGSA